MISEGGRMASTREAEQYLVVDGHDGEKVRMLKTGSIILSIWSGIHGFLASLILAILLFFHGNSPLLVMVFDKPEIAGMDARVIAAMNCLTILYNTCAVAFSTLALLIIWTSLVHSRKWAFWALLITIGFLEVLAFIASAGVGNARWQVNVVLSVLYVAGIGLAGASFFRRRTQNPSTQRGIRS
jgi:hypothetical protein